MDKDKCTKEHLCPYGIQPVVGMWGRVGDVEFWGTNCLIYTDCPRKYWTKEQWFNNPTKLKRS